jgi:NTE family protein
MNNYGLETGNKIQLFIRLLLKKKTGIDDITFLQLYKNTGKHLVITATCLNDRKLELFDYINSPHLSIAKAIRMSISLPFIMQPVQYNNKLYIDGGILNNFPLYIFDNTHKILGIEIADNKAGINQSISIDNFEDYLHSIWGCIYTEFFRTRSQINSNKNINILSIVIDWMGPLQLMLNIDEKIHLYNVGYNTALTYLSNKRL